MAAPFLIRDESKLNDAFPESSSSSGSEEEEDNNIVQIGNVSQRKPTALHRFQILRSNTYKFFNEPHFSRLAFLWSLWMLMLIVVSTISFVLETLPDLHSETWQYGDMWTYIEYICVSFFTLEFVLRLICAPSFVKFAKGPLNIIDLIAIAPFYIQLILAGQSGALAFVRVLRLGRVFRLAKLSRYSDGLRIFAATFAAALQPLGMLCFFLAIAIVFFSSIVYLFEVDAVRPNGSPSPFDSIPATFWWCIVTMLTIGYGDLYPITVGGKFFAGVAMIVGIMMVAMPISVISNVFSEKTARFQKDKARAELERAAGPKQDDSSLVLIEYNDSKEALSKLLKRQSLALAILEAKVAKASSENLRLRKRLRRWRAFPSQCDDLDPTSRQEPRGSLAAGVLPPSISLRSPSRSPSPRPPPTHNVTVPTATADPSHDSTTVTSLPSPDTGHGPILPPVGPVVTTIIPPTSPFARSSALTRPRSDSDPGRPQPASPSTSLVSNLARLRSALRRQQDPPYDQRSDRVNDESGAHRSVSPSLRQGGSGMGPTSQTSDLTAKDFSPALHPLVESLSPPPVVI